MPVCRRENIKDVFDALELTTLCGQNYSRINPAQPKMKGTPFDALLLISVSLWFCTHELPLLFRTFHLIAVNEAPSSKSYAATYYVDATKGSDSNSGSISAPFLTIQYAAYHLPISTVSYALPFSFPSLPCLFSHYFEHKKR